jgi:hypothetical protein
MLIDIVVEERLGTVGLAPGRHYEVLVVVNLITEP